MIAKNLTVVREPRSHLPEGYKLFVEINDLHKQNMFVFENPERSNPKKLAFNPLKIAEKQMMLEIVININQRFPDCHLYLFEDKDYLYSEPDFSIYYHDFIPFDKIIHYNTYQLFVPEKILNEELVEVLSNLTYFMD